MKAMKTKEALQITAFKLTDMVLHHLCNLRQMKTLVSCH